MKVYLLHTIDGWDAAAGKRLGVFVNVNSAKRRAELEEPEVTFNWVDDGKGLVTEYTKQWQYLIEELEMYL